MDREEVREKIISTVKEAIGNNASYSGDMAVLDSNDVDHIAEESADALIEAGYINGVDFVEWLKHSCFVKPYMDDVDYCMGVDIGKLAEALQEYKGE